MTVIRSRFLLRVLPVLLFLAFASGVRSLFMRYHLSACLPDTESTRQEKASVLQTHNALDNGWRLQDAGFFVPGVFNLRTQERTDLPANAHGRQNPVALSTLFPATNEVPGWALKDNPKLYSGDQLFDYMDGAGEIPRSYDFRQLGSAKYAHGNVVLEVAIFDMGRSDNAFGYYSARSFLEHSPRSKAPERILALDHPAHLYSRVGVLTFWKGRYTVIVQPDTGTPDEPTLIRFARSVGAKIKEKGSPPTFLKLLPSAGMATNSARYVRGKAAFDSLIVFQPGDVFGAAKGAEAVAAEYPIGQRLAGTLCVVRYSNAAAATDALNAYRKALQGRKAQFASSSLPNGFTAAAPRVYGTGAVTSGRYLGVVVGAQDARTADTALRSLRAGLPK